MVKIKPFLRIVLGWIIFPMSFIGWYFSCKKAGVSDGLIEDYLWWHKREYDEIKNLSA